MQEVKTILLAPRFRVISDSTFRNHTALGRKISKELKMQELLEAGKFKEPRFVEVVGRVSCNMCHRVFDEMLECPDKEGSFVCIECYETFYLNK